MPVRRRRTNRCYCTGVAIGSITKALLTPLKLFRHMFFILRPQETFLSVMLERLCVQTLDSVRSHQGCYCGTVQLYRKQCCRQEVYVKSIFQEHDNVVAAVRFEIAVLRPQATIERTYPCCSKNMKTCSLIKYTCTTRRPLCCAMQSMRYPAQF